MVLTGRKRSRGTSTGRAPSKSSTIAPRADSTWKTSGDEGSEGSTCLRLRMSGSPGGPPRTASASRSATRSNHRLFVWKKRCRCSSVNQRMSSSGVCAVSRRIIRPSLRRTARWPPLRSAGVRRQTSGEYGAPEAANQAASRPSGAAPRLSAFEVLM